jgi:beta-lactam-binding protein with PASTA domain
MKAFNFLTKRAFYINLFIIIALAIIIIEAVFYSLKDYTRHGEEIVVPDFVGKDCDSVLEQYSEVFNFVLLDSVYSKSYPEGSFYQQDPLPNSNVKKGRNLYYVKVSEAPEKVVMPNLRNLSLRQAMVLLKSNGLKVSELEFVDHFAKNAVVEQRYDGEVIEPGTEIVKGSAVKLLVGYGRGDKKTHLPNLLTAPKENVKNLIHEASLNMGKENYMDYDENERYRVYKMEPAYDIQTLVTLGSTVDVWYRSETKFDFDSYGRELFKKDSVLSVMKKKKLSADTIKYVTDSFDYILTHRLFKFDSISNEYDKNLILEKDFFEYIYRDDSLNVDSIYYEIYSSRIYTE